ncbi:oxygen-independent coproporphyrinogen-3 oxidase [Monaibacterium marinum]|uniref:Heme chaperone HemW n=1 Tax=Pontivivens marinum TaxID=1690039 RepID=A0A2C9CPW5_9RHOB|nr:radical SAM family heme chaperone HemW [Monaibacterium marinum]SOH93260.1 oxygen-independent coproporphyrinogen-3 oxidase [Monaibacterium marinum]
MSKVLSPDWRNGGFGVYVHWPFCQSKCPYCDFNSHVRREVDHAAWRDALCREIDHAAALSGPRRVDTVFFGGGTPSLMHPDTIAAIMQRIATVWSLSPDAEVTLEANPTSVEAGKFQGFRDAGINRVSMGIQALNDPDLKRLGRMHTAREAMDAFDVARRTFDRVSFDLIYARQGQDRDAWKSELNQAINLGLDHLSLYQLTIESTTRFGELHARGALRGLPSDAHASDMYFDTQEIMDAAGLSAYEISNHARAGAESQHNLIYWRYGDYAGIGPGAHGRITDGKGNRLATETLRMPEEWLNSAKTTGHGYLPTEELTSHDQAVECILMGLRLSEGINLERVRRLDANFLNEDALVSLTDGGQVSVDADQLKITPRGRPITNAILRELIA